MSAQGWRARDAAWPWSTPQAADYAQAAALSPLALGASRPRAPGLPPGVSLVGAALSPENVSFEAKWADWLRAHHAGLVAQRFEELYY